MPHVKVDSACVFDEPAVPRRFVMPPMMQIHDTVTLDLEKMVPNLVGEPGGGMVGAILMNEKTVLGLEPENAVQHGVRTMKL
jgi:hypothetical protein